MYDVSDYADPFGTDPVADEDLFVPSPDAMAEVAWAEQDAVTTAQENQEQKDAEFMITLVTSILPHL